jgi:hypothetical protein
MTGAGVRLDSRPLGSVSIPASLGSKGGGGSEAAHSFALLLEVRIDAAQASLDGAMSNGYVSADVLLKRDVP